MGCPAMRSASLPSIHLPGRRGHGMWTVFPVRAPTTISDVSSSSSNAGISWAGYVLSASMITQVSYCAAMIPDLMAAP